MSAVIYTSLLKALTMPDTEDTSCYPVRVSAAGAIMELLEVSIFFGPILLTKYIPMSLLGLIVFYFSWLQNEYFPPDWLPLLQSIMGGVGNEDEDNSILFQLLSSVVEVGNESVAVHIPYIVSTLVATISKSIPASPEPWPQV